MSIPCVCGRVPCIILPGIGQSKTAEYDYDGSFKRIVWPCDDFNTKRVIKKILPNAIRAAISRHDSGLPEKLAAAVVEELEGLQNRADGSPKNKVRAVAYPGSVADCSEEERRYIYRMVPIPTLENKLGADHIWFFTYNSFGQTFEIVEELHKYVQTVKEKTGHDRVNLVPISLGGTIATAYLAKYGDDGDINRVVSIVPAYNGSQAMADAFNDNIDYDNFRYIMRLLFGGETAGKIEKYIDIFSESTAINAIKAVIRGVVKSVLLNSVTMWGAIPWEEYESLSARLIGDEDHRELKEQTDEAFIYRRDFAKTVRHLQQRSVEFDNICCHGLKLLELCKSSTIDSDHIVHTESASMGAYITPLGEFLPRDYEQKNIGGDCGHNHISPCRTVDASAGLAPETTWYFKGQAHDFVQNCRPVLELAEWLLADEKPKTVFTDERYPQFTSVD